MGRPHPGQGRARPAGGHRGGRPGAVPPRRPPGPSSACSSCGPPSARWPCSPPSSPGDNQRLGDLVGRHARAAGAGRHGHHGHRHELPGALRLRRLRGLHRRVRAHQRPVRGDPDVPDAGARPHRRGPRCPGGQAGQRHRPRAAPHAAAQRAARAVPGVRGLGLPGSPRWRDPGRRRLGGAAPPAPGRGGGPLRRLRPAAGPGPVARLRPAPRARPAARVAGPARLRAGADLGPLPRLRPARPVRSGGAGGSGGSARLPTASSARVRATPAVGYRGLGAATADRLGAASRRRASPDRRTRGARDAATLRHAPGHPGSTAAPGRVAGSVPTTPPRFDVPPRRIRARPRPVGPRHPAAPQAGPPPGTEPDGRRRRPARAAVGRTLDRPGRSRSRRRGRPASRARTRRPSRRPTPPTTRAASPPPDRAGRTHRGGARRPPFRWWDRPAAAAGRRWAGDRYPFGVPAYLDHSASTPMRPEAVEAMLPWLTEHHANPSGAHRLAREARRALDEARDDHGRGARRRARRGRVHQRRHRGRQPGRARHRGPSRRRAGLHRRRAPRRARPGGRPRRAGRRRRGRRGDRPRRAWPPPLDAARSPSCR